MKKYGIGKKRQYALTLTNRHRLKFLYKPLKQNKMNNELKERVEDLLAGKTKSPEAVAEVVKELVKALESESRSVELYRDLMLDEEKKRIKAEQKIQSLKTLIELF